jgi:hypothetical protein
MEHWVVLIEGSFAHARLRRRSRTFMNNPG